MRSKPCSNVHFAGLKELGLACEPSVSSQQQAGEVDEGQFSMYT